MRRLLIGLIVLVAAFVVAASLSIFPDRFAYRDQFAAGEEVVERIERYREYHGTLPATLDDIGIEERLESPIHYTRRDSQQYQVWFGTSLGESITYHSERGSWE
jgi:hypothetical protein